MVFDNLLRAWEIHNHEICAIATTNRAVPVLVEGDPHFHDRNVII